MTTNRVCYNPVNPIFKSHRIFKNYCQIPCNTETKPYKAFDFQVSQHCAPPATRLQSFQRDVPLLLTRTRPQRQSKASWDTAHLRGRRRAGIRRWETSCGSDGKVDWHFEDLDFTPSDTERLIVSRSGPKNHQSVQIKKKRKRTTTITTAKYTHKGCQRASHQIRLR